MDHHALPEIERFLSLLRVQTPRAQGLFQYALVLLMIDDESARIIGPCVEGTQTYIRLHTLFGEEIEIERPAMSEEAEHELFTKVRSLFDSVFDEDEGQPGNGLFE